MNCREWEERIALYAGGDAGPAEAAAVEGHVAECAECRVLLGGMRRSMELLREAHAEPLNAAHFAAVRARVIAQIACEPRPWLRRGWVYGCVLAAAVAVIVVAVRPAANGKRDVAVLKSVEAPHRAPAVDLPAPAKMAARPSRKKTAVHDAAARRADDTRESSAPPPSTGPLMVKLITNDPDVVIYWIADGDGRGERP